MLQLGFLILSTVCVSSWTHRSSTQLSFQPKRQSLPFPSGTLFHSSLPNDEKEENEEPVSAQDHERTTTLCFRATKKFYSEPIPIPFHSNITMTKDFLDKFFSMDETYAVLLAGTNSIVSKQPRENIYTIQENWVKECRKVGADIPSFTDESSSLCLYQVQTSGGMNFPGLKVVSLITIGSTKRPSHQTTTFPEIQFVLISTENKAQGLLQWIYNALMGSNKKKKDESMEHSFTKVSVEPTLDGLNFRFTSDVMIEIGVQFPSFLLKILPVNKVKAEEQGSLAVSRFIEKDVQRSLNRLSELYAKVVQPFNG